MTLSTNQLTHYKWPVSVSQRIPATPQKIWETIASPGNLAYCHPFCKENPVLQWPGVGSQDEIHYYSGWVMRREFVKWVEGLGYDLTIGRPGGGKSYVTWRIIPMGDNEGMLTITIYPHAYQHLPVPLRWLPYRAILQPQLRKYLQAVLNGFAWYITTGEAVRKNQFGSHRWFSPDA